MFDNLSSLVSQLLSGVFGLLGGLGDGVFNAIDTLSSNVF